jgi:N-acetyl-anhydromuramyl-L-alanine amidase AmpD
MARKLEVRVRNKLLPTEAIAGAKVTFVPIAPVIPIPIFSGGAPAVAPALAPLVTGTTNRWGKVTLDITSLNGGYIVVVEAPNTTTLDVGPDIATGASPPDRIFRPMTIPVTVSASGVTVGRTVSGGSATSGRPGLQVNVQPVWMQAPGFNARSEAVSLIIVHHTGGDDITPTLNTFLSGNSAHYVIDKDGQIVKMVQDVMAANHAGRPGRSRWAGVVNLNKLSIGIEIVNRTNSATRVQDPFREEQYTALIALLKRIRTGFPGIPADGIVGHSDVATDTSGKLGRKSGCPGMRFEWDRLEREGLGIVPRTIDVPDPLYGGFFKAAPAGRLQEGDSDRRRIYGGRKREAHEVTGDPIAELQDDLEKIGYWMATTNGEFDDNTAWAVLTFTEHFHGGGGRRVERVDHSLALMIKCVRAARP